jgi:hypothetical protein
MKKISEREEALIEKGKKKARKFLESKNSEIGFVRFIGKSAFRRQAKLGDFVLEITKYGRTASVCKPRPILHRQNDGRWTRFYFKECDDTQKMSWSKFEHELKQAGISGIGKNSIKKLSEKTSKGVDKIWDN